LKEMRRAISNIDANAMIKQSIQVRVWAEFGYDVLITKKEAYRIVKELWNRIRVTLYKDENSVFIGSLV